MLRAAAPEMAETDTDVRTTEILDKYVTASKTQSETLKGLQMDVDIDAKLLKLQKYGKMHALRSISKIGQITYNYFRFSGDSTIKKDVIARYLTAESEAKDLSSLALTPANYKFKYRGLVERDNHVMYIFQVTPRKKMVGLYKGELWLDQATCMPVREAGKFVKNPSVFLKNVEFVREYELKDGIAYPSRIESTIETRIVGKAEITVNYSNYSKVEGQSAEATQAAPVSPR
ncbi:MAG: hypothetical protein ABI823_09120 [Bryobacteraceae bacterium]